MLPTEPDSFLQILLPRLSNRRHLSWKPADYHESVNRWRHTFSRKLFAKSGEWIVGGFDWHVFTYGYAEAITGKAAVDRYHQANRSPGYVFTHSGVRNPPCCLARKLPSHAEMTNARKLFPHLADIYIVDQNFHWTFVVTHEDALGLGGPFFALPQ